MIKQFKKKPVIIQAIQWTGLNTNEVKAFCTTIKGPFNDPRNVTNYLLIPTLEGEHRASIDDWIIKGVQGEFYPCKPYIFEETYEEVINDKESSS